MENGFDGVLKSLQPAKPLFEVAKAMLCDAWEMRLAEARSAKDEMMRQLAEVEKQVEQMLDRIVEASAPSVVKKYEERIEKLDRQKILLQDKSAKLVPPKGRLEELIELTFMFLSKPWYLYEKGTFAMKQTVLRLAFTEPLRYCRNGGYGNIETSFPFNVLGGLSGSDSGHFGEMVLRERIEFFPI